MSTEGTATVKWALYRANGEFTGRQGEPGTSFSGTKATAFVGTDDAFYVVTTARPTPAASDGDHHAGREKEEPMAAAEPTPWSPLAQFAGTGSIGSPGGTHPIAADGSALHAVYAQGGRIYYRRSGDAGLTWSAAILVAHTPCRIYSQ